MACDAAQGVGEQLRPTGCSAGGNESPKGEEKTMSKLTLKTEGDKHVIVTRRFAAPPEAVYRAHTDPKLVQMWLLGPEGWTMPVCSSRTGESCTWSVCSCP